jgi:Rhodopirellula transposase DDE domain
MTRTHLELAGLVSVDHPSASKLLITTDAGGSDSYRYPLWKAELTALAAETVLTITVCHFPGHLEVEQDRASAVSRR